MNTIEKLEKAEALCREVRAEMEQKQEFEDQPTICGLTAEQWEEVVRCKALVEVALTYGEEWKGPYVLNNFSKGVPAPFLAGGSWRDRVRLAYVPGHIIPWFGQDEKPPEWDSVPVIVKFRNGEWGRALVGDWTWTWDKDAAQGDITHFIILP